MPCTHMPLLTKDLIHQSWNINSPKEVTSPSGLLNVDIDSKQEYLPIFNSDWKHLLKQNFIPGR